MDHIPTTPARALAQPPASARWHPRFDLAGAWLSLACAAHCIALPLLFGLGVDSGIHMAHRLHYLHTSGGEENLLTTSEAQGVFYSALTTVFSFSSLAFTPHAGTASMGQLLAVGLMLTLLCALVVLPAFSELGRNGPRPAPVEP